MFNDYFNDNTISGGWTQEYTTGSGVEYTLTSGTSFVRIYSGLGTTHSGVNGIYQTVPSEDEFDVYTKIAETSELKYNSENENGAGMMFRIDDDNYVLMSHSKYHIGYEYIYSYEDPPGIGHAGGHGGTCTDYTLPPYYMRVKKVNNIDENTITIIPYYSDISQKWYRGLNETLSSGVGQLWLFSTHGNGEEQGWSDFEYFMNMPSGINDIEIQSGEEDIPRAGTTIVPGTAFGSLANTFVLNSCNRFCNAGASATGSATYYVDDLSGRIELTTTSGITFTRITSSTDADFKMAWQSWEYKGSAGGENEFIVRSRNIITLTAGTRNTTASLDNTPTNKDSCIPFISGISNTDTGVNSNGLTAYCWLSGTNTLNVERGGSLGTTVVQVVTVEFTGENWSVYHGLNDGYTADTGTVTLCYDAAGTETTIEDIDDWSKCIIMATQHRGTTADTDEAIADNCPTTYPNDETSVSFFYHGDHAVSSAQKLMVHALEHPDINVTRYTNTSNTAGETTIDISSAGLSNLSYSAIIGTGASSGTGTLFPRGWRLYYLNSISQAAHWCHRSGNTFSHRLQIIDVSNVTTTSGVM